MARIAPFIAAHVSRLRVRLSDEDLEVASRAFCPDVSPPDNSCSPANKGTGRPRPPKAPKPDGKATDVRGARTGHSAEQRDEYASQLSSWLRETHGIDFAIDQDSYDKSGPPTMDALRQVADGVAKLDSLGITLPETIVFKELPGNAPAGYDFRSGVVMADPDTTQYDLSNMIEKGWLSGTLSSEQWGLYVHEMTHHDHREEIKRRLSEAAQGAAPDDILFEETISTVRGLMGRPTKDGPTKDPWDPELRFTSKARRSPDNGGDPLPGELARAVAGEVSGYAKTNPLEFVAEVRTGLASGISYSEEVMQLYDDYGGPPLPRKRRN